MRLLLILNENPVESHRDVRYSLERLVLEGILEDYLVYPFLTYRAQGRSDDQISREIYEVATSFRPGAILWSHTGNLKISPGLMKKLRDLPSAPSIGYRDADIYQSFYKPLPKEVVILSRQCDVSFWPGYSKTIEKLRNKGCKDIRYVPLTTDEEIFSSLRQDEKPEYDVVMIGNLVKSRIPFKDFPGSRLREAVARHFHKKLGSRFAVFGAGWDSAFRARKVPFHQQNKIYHQSRLVLGVNNLHAHYYFSNRLPIALSSGVLILHNYEKGVRQIFQGEYPYFFRHKYEAWEMAQALLSKPQEELDALALHYRSVVMKKLTMTSALQYMISVLKEYKNQRNGQTRSVINNPWINLSQL